MKSDSKMDIESGIDPNTQEKGDLKELLHRIKGGYTPKLVAFISDLGIQSEDVDLNLDDFELFVDWLVGQSSAKELATCVNTLVIAGG